MALPSNIVYRFCIKALDFMYLFVPLLVPIWPSSCYWPLIYPDGYRMADFMKQHVMIEHFYSSEVRESVFNGYHNFKTLVLNIDCTES